MARALSPREIGLAVALGLVVLVYLWYASDVDLGGGGGGAPPTAAKDGAGGLEAPVVHIELLEVKAVESRESARDLFKYEPRPPSAAELAEARRLARLEEEARRRQEEEARRAREAAARAAAERATNPPPPAQPQPPRVPFKYLGYLGPKDERLAAFEDGQEILVARVGDVLREQFRLVDIQYDSVVIGYTQPEFEGRTQTLNMTRRK